MQMTDTRMKACFKICEYGELHPVAEEKPQEYFSDGRAHRKTQIFGTSGTMSSCKTRVAQIGNNRIFQADLDVRVLQHTPDVRGSGLTHSTVTHQASITTKMRILHCCWQRRWSHMSPSTKDFFQSLKIGILSTSSALFSLWSRSAVPSLVRLPFSFV